MAPLYVIVCPIICFEVSGVLDIEGSACESMNRTKTRNGLGYRSKKGS